MRLSVDSGPLAGTQLLLDRERPTTIGSAASCTLVLTEAGVAAEHAVVKALRDEGFGVKALAAGLRVNGREVEATPLRDGDVLELGTSRITYSSEAKSKGPQIQGFKVLGELGRGGMGIVYRAEQVSLHRQVALKVLDQRLTRDAQFVARFVAEARAAAKLQHPNVVAVFDVDQDAGTYYYAMELMQGSLESWLKKNGKLPVERALQAMAEAAAGLAYAESLGIVHRDIKPDNLMLDQHGTVKIADLGLARSDGDDQDHHAGTPHFMAPEQIQRKGVDHRTDLYALGCTFYRLVTGRTPFRGQTVKDILRAHLKDDAEPAHKVEPSVPNEVSAIIQKLMQKEPADRFQSANDLHDALTTLLQPPAKKGLWIGLAATAVLVAGGAILWAINKPKEQTIVEKYRDNPEAQRLATENEQLKAQTHQDAATIALLQARVRGLAGEELAAALEAVAAAHPGMRAADEARTLATQARTQAQAQQVEVQQRGAATERAIALLSQQVGEALTAGNPPRALDLAAKAKTPAGVDESAFAAAVREQQQRVQTFARDRLKELGTKLEAARTAKDAESLADLTTQVQAILANDGGWPAALLPERAAVEATLQQAQKARTELLASASSEQWQRFDQWLRDPQACAGALGKLDFAAAATAATTFADGLGDAPPAQQARRLGAALQQAAAFADALLPALASGKLQLPGAGANDAAQTVARWQRDQGTLIVLDASKKPAKEVALPIANVLPEQWAALAAAVQGAPDGSRECFLCFTALGVHVPRARAWLQTLAADKDESGTGDAGYPLSTTALDQALRTLPAGDAPWNLGVRHELTAARLLVAGLRALSERRNLAAAGQLERLLADHPHSLAAAWLQ